jgi:hypothetical protein
MENRIQYCLLVFAFVVESCNQTVKEGLHSGLNETKYPSGKIHQKFFVDRDQLDGVYIEYNNKNEIKRIGTYTDNRRNGLWDTILKDDHISQVYYVNDTPTAIIRNKVFFSVLIQDDDNLVFLSPKKWIKKDTVIVEGQISGREPNHHGKYIPAFTVHHMNATKRDIKEILKSFVTDLPNSGDSIIQYNITDHGKIYISLLHANTKDTLLFDCKVIKNDYGFFAMMCCVNSSEYPLYHMIFETMLNSFNPMNKVENIDSFRKLNPKSPFNI